MQNAAIYFHPNAFDTTTGRLLGRHSAGESFLRGFLQHAEIDRLHLWDVAAQGAEALEPLLHRIAVPRQPVRWIPRNGRALLRDPGVMTISSPQINVEAWHRRAIGAREYAICGLTHTTSTSTIMDTIGDLLIAPTECYDALICTSSAVRASVESQLDDMREYLNGEYGPRRRAEPQRVTIPLGVNTSDFSVTAGQRSFWRARLGIPDQAVVALYVGRFNVREKMNPALMAIALEKAVIATGRPIYWVNSGWAESEETAQIYHAETQALCPSVKYISVDGRAADTRFAIWSVADFFISFSDNIQESFGLTPIEAMAAGLPCVVTDWDGYKDTVRHGEDGFRIRTTTPTAGLGGDLAHWFANGWINYPTYVGATSQYTAVDYGQAVEAISALVLDENLRKKLGAQARVQARAVFDWAAIVPQYQALWAEQNDRRLSLPAVPRAPTNPLRPDPYRLFENYSTRQLSLTDRVQVTSNASVDDALALLASPLASHDGMNRPTETEVRHALEWISANPGGSVAELLDTVVEGRQAFMRRGLLWIARYGIIGIRPLDE